LERDPHALRHALVGAAIASLCVAGMGLLYIKFDIYRWKQQLPWEKVPQLLLSAAVVALLEETLFRGAIFGLFRRTLRPFAALFWVTLIFAAVHFLKPDENVQVAEVNWSAGFALLPHLFHQFAEPMTLLAQFTTIFVLGWVLGYATLRTRSLWMAMGLHAGVVFVKMTFSKCTKRQEEILPWIGSELQIGLVPVVVLVFCGLCVWYWISHVRCRCCKQFARWVTRRFRCSTHLIAPFAVGKRRACTSMRDLRGACPSDQANRFASNVPNRSMGRWRGHLPARTVAIGNITFIVPCRAISAATVVRDFIHRFKYNGHYYLRHQLAEWLGATLADERIATRRADFLVPVPLHSARLREREFNQADVLARLLALRSGLPVRACLQRIPTPARRLGSTGMSAWKTCAAHSACPRINPCKATTSFSSTTCSPPGRRWTNALAFSVRPARLPCASSPSLAADSLRLRFHMGIFNKPAFSSDKKREFPEGLWQKCLNCGEMIHNLELAENQRVLPQVRSSFHHDRAGAPGGVARCRQFP
jgi:membrane protease YdiL (CAAX protease family)